MEYKIFDTLPDDARYIRTTVFVEEQGFNEEFDSTDNYARHIVLYKDSRPVAVGRYFTDDGKEYHIGRVAILKEYRKFGLGKVIMELIENDIRKTEAERIVLSAQCRARGFYEKCGFTAQGDVYLDEYCEHILMVKEIKND